MSIITTSHVQSEYAHFDVMISVSEGKGDDFSRDKYEVQMDASNCMAIFRAGGGGGGLL